MNHTRRAALAHAIATCVALGAALGVAPLAQGRTA